MADGTATVAVYEHSPQLEPPVITRQLTSARCALGFNQRKRRVAFRWGGLSAGASKEAKEADEAKEAKGQTTKGILPQCHSSLMSV